MPADDHIPTREEVLDAIDALDGVLTGDDRDLLALVRRHVVAHESRAAMRELLDRVARALEAQAAPRAPAVLGWLRGIPPRDLIQYAILIATGLGLMSRMPTLPAVADPSIAIEAPATTEAP